MKTNESGMVPSDNGTTQAGAKIPQACAKYIGEGASIHAGESPQTKVGKNNLLPAQKLEPLTSGAVGAGGSIGTNKDLVKAVEFILAGKKLQRLAPRQVDDTLAERIRKDLLAVSEDRKQEYLGAAKLAGELPDQILAVVKKASIMDKKDLSGFNDPKTYGEMRQNIAAMINAGQPIVMGLLLGGGKMANPIKTGGVALPDLSEWHAMVMLSALTGAVASLYPPGARLIASPDALLHTADLGLNLHSAIRHLTQLRKDLAWLGVEREVHVPDVVRFLPKKWDDLVAQNSRTVNKRLPRDPKLRYEALQQVESLQYSLNSEALGLPYEDLVLAYGALRGHLPRIPAFHRRVGRDLFERTVAVLPHYIGVNYAIRQAKLIKRMAQQFFGSPLHLRLSVHAKPGNPRPALFAKNELVSSLEQLPTHALGVWQDDHGRSKFGIAFDLSGRVHGWKPLVWRGRMIGYEAHAGRVG